MNLATLPWIILFAPLVAAAIILFLGKYSRTLSSGLAILSALVAGVLSWILFLSPEVSEPVRLYWLNFGDVLNIPFGLTINHLTKVMLVVVNTIAPLVFIYSLGYMAKEEGYWRYFGGLALFLFSMLGIVLADNLVMMFIFWELVGVSSYILIGHYYGKDSAAEASKQAFLVNRIGDFGFMLGILMIWFATGSVGFDVIFTEKSMAILTAHPVYLATAAILIFCGTIGKSAQFPLHVWLPNSMEGPTPVSSLLHAATMVAAGVFFSHEPSNSSSLLRWHKRLWQRLAELPASAPPSWPRSRTTLSGFSLTRPFRNSDTWSWASVWRLRRTWRCSTSLLMRFSSACCSFAPVR